MQRVSRFLAAVLAISLAPVPIKLAFHQKSNTSTADVSTSVNSATLLHETRQLPSDLEVGGDIAGLPPETTRYITREDLLALPPIEFTASDDINFTDAPRISGVTLEELVRRLSAHPGANLVVAICDDLYRASYSRAYIAAHHPVLVLNVNGKPPSGWPKDSQEHKFDMGPYMISHPTFTPSFEILSHTEEPQIPWGVVRIEFRGEKVFLGAIAPRGAHAAESAVQAGFLIAQQNCFRCHNMGNEGGRKSSVPWTELAQAAKTSPETFAAYVRDPQQQNPNAQMPGNPAYDDATLNALASYFKTFAPSEKP
jgi:mono/diheme cytochrome c family protein